MISDSQLIFIISQPRAGSTFLQKVISNNTEVATASEPWLLLPFANFFRDDLIRAKYNEKVAGIAFHDYLKKTSQEHVFNKELKSLLLSLYQRALGEKKYFLDKTPRYYEVLPQLIDWFPNARIVVLKRNPFAVLHSMIQTWGNGKIELNNLLSYERDYLEAPVLIQNFLDSHGTAENIMELKYEDIVSNPEDDIRRIYDWLNVPFSPKILNFGRNDQTKGIFGDDVYKIKRSKSYDEVPKSSSLNSWENQLGKKHFKEFFTGYERSFESGFISRYGYPSLKPSIIQKDFRIFKKLIYLKNNPELAKFSLRKFFKYKYL